MQTPRIHWPAGKKFAFTIVDDTDQSQVANTKPVYDFLAEHDIRTTKTVWPLRAKGKPITGGGSLQDEDYLRWVLDLKAKGVEIAMHGVADESSPRARVIEGLDTFKALIGNDPEMHVNHVGQKEGMYWGSARFDTPVRELYEAYLRVRKQNPQYAGHVENSPHFWGDLCRERIRFVRNMVWSDVNTLSMDPLMPYHDPRRPYVQYWYSSSHGSSVSRFCRLLSEANQDRLVEEQGACIVYTHLGSTFFPLNPDFVRLMRRLASLGGWFVPASTLLNYIGDQRGWTDVSKHRLRYASMQARWLSEQFLHKLF